MSSALSYEYGRCHVCDFLPQKTHRFGVSAALEHSQTVLVQACNELKLITVNFDSLTWKWMA